MAETACGTGYVKTKDPGVRDIAQMAGVSTATVSRVLNAHKQVSEETRRKVQEVIRALNYVPDATARAFTVRKTSTIGAIVPTVDNAVYARGLAAAQRYLATKGYTMLLATSEYDPDVELRQARESCQPQGRRTDPQGFRPPPRPGGALEPATGDLGQRRHL